MSLSQTFRHNQFTIVSITICLLVFGVFFGCHLTRQQKQAIITAAVPIAEAAATGVPIPWTDIGIALSTIFGSGVFIDNRRKDVLIKSLKKQNANQLDIFKAIAVIEGGHPPRVPPVNNN